MSDAVVYIGTMDDGGACSACPGNIARDGTRTTWLLMGITVCFMGAECGARFTSGCGMGITIRSEIKTINTMRWEQFYVRKCICLNKSFHF